MRSDDSWQNMSLTKKKIQLIQINVGNRCNLSCYHCHVDGSPSGENNMDQDTAVKIIAALKKSKVEEVEFTGGAPELNPHLRTFIEELSATKKITVRTNLAVLDEPEHSSYIDFYRNHKVQLVASLPCVYEENVDQQRGAGVYQKNIKVLKKLNRAGYGTSQLTLNLVYNPGGAFLPGPQGELEELYKKNLKKEHDIEFNSLYTMVNSPIKRFRAFLESENKLDDYLKLLEDEYNPATLENLMCRFVISLNYQGLMFDCDFNQALRKPVKDFENMKFWEIDLSEFQPKINLADHCYACTASAGSSCCGTLVDEQVEAL